VFDREAATLTWLIAYALLRILHLDFNSSFLWNLFLHPEAILACPYLLEDFRLFYPFLFIEKASFCAFPYLDFFSSFSLPYDSPFLLDRRGLSGRHRVETLSVGVTSSGFPALEFFVLSVPYFSFVPVCHWNGGFL